MERGEYYQPGTCIPGKFYYVKASGNGSLEKYRSVKFVDYRPHPAEVIVHDGRNIMKIRRIYLLQKKGEE